MEEELLAVQRQGSLAHASGRSVLDNPFFRVQALPTQTGEPVLAWEAKCDAWELGWRMRDITIREG